MCTSCVDCNYCCYPHPFNCKYFFSCNKGLYNIQQCPVNTGYNPATYTCEPKYQCYLHDCLNLCSTLECEEDCCSPNDCETYFQCRNGTRVSKWCNEGYFNPNSLRCETDYSCFEEETTPTPILDKEEFLNAIYSVYRNLELSILKKCWYAY